jgi:hypothetical protein
MADDDVLTVAEVARRLGGTKTGWRIPASEVTRLLTGRPLEDSSPST